MSSPVLVTGGTGTLGRLVVPLLLETGRQVRVLSRRVGSPTDGVEFVTGDLDTGDGVAAAVEGTQIVLHLAGSTKGDENKAHALVRAAAAAGVRHLVYISVVGADRIPVTGRIDRAMFGYFAAKFAAEQVVAGSPVPWTTLRATQFHDLLLLVARQLGKFPVMPAPAGFRFQPIDAGEVAARLVDLALGEPAGLVPDLAGPRAAGVDELLRAYQRAVGIRRPVVPLPLPGAAARAIRAGANLASDGAVGRVSWEDFLATRLAAPGAKV